MRMRFWATIRSPAFSISALIAPVKLRAVASGLMIEKVRSIAMIPSLEMRVVGSCGAYIGATVARQAIRPSPSMARMNYNNFTKVNQSCTDHPGFVQLAWNRFYWTEDL